MGIVINQSAKNLTTTYLGFGIGAINVLFLYTHFLRPEYYGLIGFLLSAANLMWPLMAFGVHNSLVKFYSSYKSNEQKDRLLSMVLLLPLLISVVLGVTGYFFYGFILDYFSDKNQLVQPYVWLIFVIAFSTSYFEIFYAWAKVNYKSVFGNFMKEVFHRALVALLLLGVYFSWLGIREFVFFLVGVYVVRMLIMGFYASKLNPPNLSFMLPANKTSVFKYSALILIAGSVAMVLLDFDKVMIEYFMPIENVAVYGIAIYIASVIAVPAKAMHQITYPMTATLMNGKDEIGLKSLYKSSSINLLLISGLIFVLIVCNLREIYELIPPEYQISFVVIILISGVKLYDNLLGNINSILYNSDYYRLVLFIGVLLAVLAFVFNLIFIPKYGLLGAALATFMAYFAYNTSKFFIVLKKFKMQPFTLKTLWGLLVVLLFFLIFYFWDFSFQPVFNIILKSVLIGIVYLSVVFALNLSPDINTLIKKYLRL